MPKTLSRPLTWDELAEIYDAEHSRRARTLPMDEVFRWAESQPHRFRVHPQNDTLHQVIEVDE